ncbi:hypothetical protein Hanom_Chr08g00708861 [Helianthus anomalus]
MIDAPTTILHLLQANRRRLYAKPRPKPKKSTRNVVVAKIWKLLGEQLLLKDTPNDSLVYKKDQRYHGKVREITDLSRQLTNS